MLYRKKRHSSFYQQKGEIIVSVIIGMMTAILAYRYYQHTDIVVLFSAICGAVTSSKLIYKRLIK